MGLGPADGLRQASGEDKDRDRGREGEGRTALEEMSRPQLLLIVSALSEKLGRIERERQSLQRSLTEADGAVVKLKKKVAEFKDLEEAHMQQSKIIQKMQKQQSKIETYKATIQMQEKVIAKMQAVVEARLRQPVGRQHFLPEPLPGPTSGSEPVAPLGAALAVAQVDEKALIEAAEAKAELAVAKEEIERLHSEVS